MQHHKLRSTLSDEQKRLNELNREQGASSWLTTIPHSEEGYDLTKQLFWDLICIRYGWTLARLPSNCECDNKFDIRHPLSCKKGGFCFLATQPHQKYYVDTFKRSLQRFACATAASTNIFNIQLQLVMKSDLISVFVGSCKQVRWYF